MLQHDPAPALAIAVGEECERRLDPLRVVLDRLGELLDGQRLRRHDEESLDRARELVDRIRCNQAERTFHDRPPSTSPRATLIGANGAACWISISPVLRSSSRARNATATSTR